MENSTLVIDRESGAESRSKVPQAWPDPFALVDRLLNRLHSWWLQYTYPFVEIGTGFFAHRTCDIRRPMVPNMKIGKNVWLDRDVWLNIPRPPATTDPVLILEDGCKIGRRCMISAKNLVRVGHDTIFGPSVLITDHLHQFEDVNMPIALQGETAGGTVTIEEGCWFGFGAVIVCSHGHMVIGRNSVIGANSVVTRSVPPYSVVAGNPGRIVKQFDREKGVWVLGSARSPATQEKP